MLGCSIQRGLKNLQMWQQSVKERFISPVKHRRQRWYNKKRKRENSREWHLEGLRGDENQLDYIRSLGATNSGS